MPNFQFFSFQVKQNLFRSGQKVPGSKGGLASYLLRVKSISSGQGPSQGQPPSNLENFPQKSQFFLSDEKKSHQVSPLFPAVQKYARVRLGKGPSLVLANG